MNISCLPGSAALYRRALLCAGILLLAALMVIKVTKLAALTPLISGAARPGLPLPLGRSAAGWLSPWNFASADNISAARPAPLAIGLRRSHALTDLRTVSASFVAYTTQYCTLPLCLDWASSNTEDTRSLAWGDYDNDGDLDLAVGNYGQPNHVYRNDHGVLTTSGIWSSTESDDTQSVAWGDYDGDSDLDLVVGNAFAPNRLYRNDTGVLTPSAVWSSNESDFTLSVAWGDYDGDGDLDLAVGNAGPNRLYRNDTGVLTPSAVWSSSESDTTWSVAWGDSDGDGDLDLAAGNDFAPNRLYRNDGGTLLLTAVWASSETDHSRSVAWGDYDGDGDPDLAVGNYPEANRIYRNDGGALTPSAIWSSAESDNTYSVAWADYDSDGDLDLATGNAFGPSRLYRNDAGVLPANAVWSSAESDFTYNVAWGDYDGDGDLDLAVGGNGPNRLYRNDAGVLAPGVAWSSVESSNTNCVAWGDYDGDGDLDLVLGNGTISASQPNRIYRNAGGALTPSAVWSSNESDDTRSVAWGDYDSDGDLDLIVGNYNQPNRLYRNEAGALTLSAVWSSVESDDTLSVAWGDYDNDGDLDLAVGNYYQPTRLYRNDAGILTPGAIWSSAGSGRTLYVVWGDYDNDGDLDFVSGNYVYRNESSGSGPTFTPIGFPGGSSAAWGDYDSDGDLDIAVGNFGLKYLYRNDAGVVSPIPVWSSAENDDTESVAWGDYDGDGDLDLVAGNLNQPNRLYRNDGGTLTTSAVWSSAPDHTSAVAWGDYDSDGDLDLAVGNAFGPSRLYRNGRDGRLLPGAVPLIHIAQPGANAEDYSKARVLSGTIPITYTVHATPSGLVQGIHAYYALNGEGDWRPAVAAAGTVTQSLSTTSLFTRTAALTPSLPIADLGLVTSTLVFTATDTIADLDVRISLNHANVGDLVITLTNPLSQAAVLINRRGAGAAGLVNTVFDDEAATSILSGSVPYNGRHRPEQALARFDGSSLSGPWMLSLEDVASPTSGLLNSWGLTITLNSGQVYTYNWDAVASGFFGQSDNVAFRIEAAPAILAGVRNAVPGPYIYGRYASSTFPFRVRGTQIQVVSGTQPVGNTIVYRLPQGQTLNAALISDLADMPFHTDGQGYLQGRGQLNAGDRLVALAPLTATSAYKVFATSAAPTANGLNMYTVPAGGGVQTLNISAANPLIVFNLDVSLEWDARNDPQYLAQLKFDFERASQILFDASNGQVALGDVNIYQAQANQADADVRIFATNAVRPFAAMGGVVLTPTVEIANGHVITYTPGQVILGASWNRYGDPGVRIGEDYARTLAHELSHWMLYQDDDYLGLDAGGHLVPVSACSGTMMSDAYLDANSEYYPDTNWAANCANTLANLTTGRSDWATLKKFYPWVNVPATALAQVNPGPSSLPLAVTQVRFIEPITASVTLPDPRFYLKDSGGASLVTGKNARIVLYRDSASLLIDEGRPVLDQAVARGAQPGDRVCVYDPAGGRVGCKIVAANDNQTLVLGNVTNWQPDVRVTLPTSRSVSVQVSNLPAGLTLRATLYGANVVISQTISPIGTGVYATTINTGDFTIGAGQVLVEAASDPDPNTRRALLSDFALGGNIVVDRNPNKFDRNPNKYDRNPNKFDRNPNKFDRNAPVISSDGYLILYAANVDFPADSYYVIQEATSLPQVPAWAAPVGKGYWLTASTNAPALTQASLSLVYAQSDVPAGQEQWLKVYRWEGTTWTPLATQLNMDDNSAIAPAAGPGLYALMASVEIPVYGPGWNNIPYPVVTLAPVPIADALASIAGNYNLVFHYQADTDAWHVYPVALPAYVGDLTALTFGQSYWINVTNTATLKFNPAPMSAQVAGLVPPALYYGPAEAPPGQPVIASVGGVVCGQGQTRLDPSSGQTVYTVLVRAEGPAPAGCGATGRSVQLRTGQVTARVTWDNSQAWLVPLSAHTQLFLPMVQR